MAKKKINLMASKRVQVAIKDGNIVRPKRLADQIHDGFSKQAEILLGKRSIGTVGYSDTMKGRKRWMSLDPESDKRFTNRTEAVDLCYELSCGNNWLWDDDIDQVSVTFETMQKDNSTRKYIVSLQRDGAVFVDCSLVTEDEVIDLFGQGCTFRWHRINEAPVRTTLATILIHPEDWSLMCKTLNTARKEQTTALTDEVKEESTEEEETQEEGLLDIYADSPYDPSQAEFIRKSHTVSLLMTRIKEGELKLDPEFQREAGLWSSKTQSRLIESLLLGIPLPLFIFRGMPSGDWQCVDGLQRLTTLVNFISGEMKLRSLEYLPLKGSTFQSLHRKYQRKILESELSCVIIGDTVPVSVTFNVFSRLNAGGTKLNRQELRHALNQGQATIALKDLAQSPEFMSAVSKGIASKRMQDREVVLRFMAFSINDPKSYKGGMDQFLAKAIAQINLMTKAKLRDMSERFKHAMNIAHNLLGDDAFRIHTVANPERRSRINKAMFECWSCAFGRLQPSQVDFLVNHRDDFKAGLLALITTDELYCDSVTAATSRTSAVQTRHETAEKYIKAKILEYAAKVGKRRPNKPKATKDSKTVSKAPTPTQATQTISEAPVETPAPSNGISERVINGHTEFTLSEINKQAVRKITRKAIESGVTVILPSGARAGVKTIKVRGNIAYVAIDLLTGIKHICGNHTKLLAQLQNMA